MKIFKIQNMGTQKPEKLTNVKTGRITIKFNNNKNYHESKLIC